MSSCALAIPSPVGGFGFITNYYGFADYNESSLELAYGKRLGETVSIGVAFHYNMIHIAGYGNGAAPGLAVALMLHPSEKVNIGLQVTDPAGGSFGKSSGEKLASIYQLGIGYEASPETLITAELIKQEESPINLNAVIRYRFAGQFIAVAGVLANPGTPYFGLGISWKQFRIDITTSYHVQLGFSPGMLLMFSPSSDH